MKFTDIDFQPHPHYAEDGIQAKHFFPNGYGVSVVRFPGSYGYEEGLYEVAILKGLEEDWEICYDTEITDDVIGYLTEDQVGEVLVQVENLI
jgi:hypothetical protein